MDLNFDADTELRRDKLFRELSTWLNYNADKDDPAAIFALLECVQDLIDKMDFTDYGKGAILSSFFETLAETNKEKLAIYHTVKNAIREKKEFTIQ